MIQVIAKILEGAHIWAEIAKESFRLIGSVVETALDIDKIKRWEPWEKAKYLKLIFSDWDWGIHHDNSAQDSLKLTDISVWFSCSQEALYWIWGNGFIENIAILNGVVRATNWNESVKVLIPPFKRGDIEWMVVNNDFAVTPFALPWIRTLLKAVYINLFENEWLNADPYIFRGY